MFSLTRYPIVTASILRGVHVPASGAVVSFEGRVRNHNHGQQVVALEYEAYDDLAVSEGLRVIEEAAQRFGLQHAVAVHRTGSLILEDVAVLVVAAAAHRDAAFAGCRYMIDEIKARLPIWKCETYADGRSEWVGCHECTLATHRRHQVRDDSSLNLSHQHQAL